jgi:hypothetical protein
MEEKYLCTTKEVVSKACIAQFTATAMVLESFTNVGATFSRNPSKT